MKILVPFDEACNLLSIARTTLYREVRMGRITPMKRGKRTFFHRDELERYAIALKPGLARRG